MERRFAVRKRELLAECDVSPNLFADWEQRLAEFVEPFAALLGQEKQQEHVATYVSGLLSNVQRKNAESIAYEHDQDRKNLQHFIGQAPWSDASQRGELARQVAAELGESDGVLVFDPSGFAKKGCESAGVARQWCGRLGKIDNCQMGVYLAYVARREHVLVDVHLYLPEEWTKDKKRCQKAGIPKEVRFATRHALALQMLDEHGATLPHRWITGDDEMGRSSGFRRELRGRQEQYLLMIPSNTTIRDLGAPLPAYGGRGRHPQQPFQGVDHWAAALPANGWTECNVRDGTKGPLIVEVARCCVQARTERSQPGGEETLLVFRAKQDDGTWKHDYALSNAPAETPLAEFARVFKAEHRIEECFQRSKSEAGLADYEVRGWRGWHHHQTLSLIAVWFITRETLRGKKIRAGINRPASPRRFGTALGRANGPLQFRYRQPQNSPPTPPKRTSGILSLETPQTLTALAH
jgi:SRSO17 transposase